MMNKLFFTYMLLCISFASAAFDGDYTFTLESATQTQINNISTPQNGMMVFNTTNNEINYYNGSAWIVLSAEGIYETDKLLSSDREVNLNTNNLGFMAGNVGIGDATPDATLDVNGSLRLDGAYYDKDGDVGTATQALTSTATGTDWTSSMTAPNVSNTAIVVASSSSITITLAGSNFVPSSIVTIESFNGTINSTNVISPTEIQLNITTGSAGTFDIVVSNNGILNTQWTGNGVGLLQVN